MKYNKKILISSAVLLVLSGCSGKNFTMQDYADKWFNDKSEQEVKKIDTEASTVKNEVSSDTNPLDDNVKEVSNTNVPDAEVEEASNVAKSNTVNPGKSSVGASIAPSSVNKRDEHMQGQGSMQKNLDAWTKEEWEPAFEGDKDQAEKDKEANEHFTIQHYIDKYEKYSDAKEEKFKQSGEKKPEANYEKMNRMPVIGK